MVQTACPLLLALLSRPAAFAMLVQTAFLPGASQVSAAFLGGVMANVMVASSAAPVHAYAAHASAGEEARFDGLLLPGARLVLADGTDGAAPGIEGFGRSLPHATRALLGMGHGGAVCRARHGPLRHGARPARADGCLDARPMLRLVSRGAGILGAVPRRLPGDAGAMADSGTMAWAAVGVLAGAAACCALAHAVRPSPLSWLQSRQGRLAEPDFAAICASAGA